MKTVLSTAAVAAALLVSACATKPYVPTLYDAQMTEVKSVAVVADSMDEGWKTYEAEGHLGTAAAAGGLIGTLVVSGMEAAETASRNKRLTEIMADTDFDPEAEFEAMLVEKLQANGFADVAMVGGERAKRRLLKDGEYPETTADAVLDVNMVNFGIGKAKTGEEWRPTAGVLVRMVSADTGDILLDHKIRYNSGNVGEPSAGSIVMNPDADSVGYLKVKEIDADVMTAQMRDMIDEITDQIVGLLT